MSLADPIIYQAAIKEFAQNFKSPVPWETIESIRSAIQSSEGDVSLSITLPKEIAEKVLTLVSLERIANAIVVPAQKAFSLHEAAVILKMPKDNLESLIEEGEIPATRSRMSWRIAAQDIVDYLDRRKSAQMAAARRLALMTAP